VKKATKKPAKNASAKPAAKARPVVSAETLLAAASDARERAYAPYSRYHVGAAVLGDNGKIYAAANVENASYGLSICAERNAISAAILDGARHVLACAVVTASSPPAAPCGMCRQTLSEFSPRPPTELPIALANADGERRNTRLSAILPLAFRPEDLG
jgi:cytidine deaminase